MAIKIRVDAKKMEDLLRNFYLITGIRIVVFDDNFEKIAEYPGNHCGYCKIVRKDPNARALCKISDIKGCGECKKLKKLHIYECHAGLMEAVAPLKVGDIIIGYLMLGQLLLEDGQNRRQKWNRMYDRVKNYEIDFEALENSFWKKTSLTEEKLYAVAKLMESCASHLYVTETISVEEEDLSRRIEAYIMKKIHKGAEITIEDICDEFEIRRTKLYEISNHSFGMGISEHIRRMRVKVACDLLRNTEDRVSDIATEVGIPDYNYFTKVFKKAMGVTPREYRKSMRKQT